MRSGGTQCEVAFINLQQMSQLVDCADLMDFKEVCNSSSKGKKGISTSAPIGQSLCNYRQCAKDYQNLDKAK